MTHTVLVLNAQHQFRHLETFGRETGMGNNVLCMTEDCEGFFWVGTYEGLFRFDGTHARQVYYKLEENLGFGAISDLSYDSLANQMWFCSDRGIFRYDLYSKAMDRFHPEDFVPKSEVQMGNKCIYRDRQGEWWGDFNTLGLSRFLPEKKQLERFVVSEGQLKNGNAFTLANTVMAVTQDARHDSIIWAGTRRGLIRVNKVTKSVQHFWHEHPDGLLEELSNAMICLLSHPSGRLFIGTWNGGLLEFDPTERKFRQYFIHRTVPNLEGLKNKVEALLPDGPDALWVGSDFGICRFDLRKSELLVVKEDATLHCKDKKGNFWGYSNVLARYDRFKNQFRTVQMPAGDIKSFRLDTSSGAIFYKQYGQPGVLAFDPLTRTARGFPFPGNTTEPIDGDVLAFTSMGLMANDLEQLYLLPRGQNAFVPLLKMPADAGWFYSASLPDGGAVITGERGYLLHFKPNEQVPRVYTPQEVGGGIEGFPDGLMVLEVDHQGRAWMRSSKGFAIFDPQRAQIQRFPYQNAPEKNLSDVRDFLIDSKGRMWCIGPEELCWFDAAHPEQGIQRRYNASNGFDFGGNWRLRVDRNDRIWFTCAKGMVQFFPETETYRIIPSAGKTMEFLPDGKVVIGFWTGITLTHLDSLLADSSAPRPYVTGLKVLGKEKPLLGKFLSPNEIWLASDENFISIGFSALGFLRPEDFRFAYQLVGVDEDWVNADADNLVAAYTALDGGDYLFRLKVRDATGRWSEQLFEWRIHIATPWYRTWLAWLVYAGLLAWAVRWWLRSRDRQLLVQQKLREEQREAERLKELDHFKNRFFTNITHEFRTPLTVILGMAGELEADAKAEQTAQGLRSKMQQALPFIRRNGQRLLDLVNQMLALARLDASSLPVQMKRGDVMLHLRIWAEAFHSYAISQKIGLQFHADPEQLEMDFDPELLQRIVVNLISNALKFTQEYGNVLVTAKGTAGQGEGEALLIEVRDSGIGISEEQIPHIFDRFYQGSAAPLRGEESSGIGLALVKEIVGLLHGRIEVESKPERGSTFRVWLPMTRKAEKSDEMEPLSAVFPLSVKPPKEADETAESGKPLVLVVEDNADVLAYIRTCLLPNWEVLGAQNGTLGLALAQENLPDVIISDVMMPGMDGFALTEALKTDVRTSHIPVLLLTAKSSRADLIEGLSKGADDYLVKPFDKAELLLRLHNFHQRQLRWQSRSSTPESSDPLPPTERAFLNKVDAAIEARLDDTDFRSEYLARAVALSRVQLHRKLTALAGTSTSLYIRRYRLQRAKQLLASAADLTVSEVAWKVGFENLSWFSQAYREEFGESPRDSRK